MSEPTGAAAAGAGAGNAGDGKGGATGTPPEGYISKADYDKNVGELQQQLEDLKLEVVTPEYIQFLEGKKAPTAPIKTEPEKVDFSRMTPDQIYAKAVADAEARFKPEIEKVRNEFSATSREQTKREVDAFARSTPDFEKYRPLMHGLSVLTKNKDLTIQELYSAAKAHAQGFGPTAEEIARSRRSGGERPGGSSSSMQKDKKYTAESAAEEAFSELPEDSPLKG